MSECGCGCGHDHDHVHEEMEMETLTLTLDDDTELECGVLGVFAVEGIEGKEFIALLPLEDETVLLYEYKEDEEGIELLNIESDEMGGAKKIAAELAGFIAGYDKLDAAKFLAYAE